MNEFATFEKKKSGENETGNAARKGIDSEPKNDNNEAAKVLTEEEACQTRLQKLWVEHIPCIVVNKPDGTEYSIKYKTQKHFQTRRIRLSHLPARIPNAIRILITTVKPKKVQKKRTTVPYKKFKKL